VFLVVVLQQIRCMDIIYRLPCVITLRVFLPLDKILQGMTVPKAPVILDDFDFVFFFSCDKIRWQPGEVQPMLCHFMIGQ
jgi:hypothetical protein